MGHIEPLNCACCRNDVVVFSLSRYVGDEVLRDEVPTLLIEPTLYFFEVI